MSTTAVQIVERVGGSYVLNVEALKRILKNCMNKKVAVVTVAGAFRKGKSFLLSNCVRYLQDGDGWMDPSARVAGFAWKQSKQSVTEGILMWPEPFLVKDRNGNEIAILLMDTEGAFDSKTSMGQCATVFALAALLSSVLVYNVMQDIQEDTLNHLQFFAKYGSFALDEEDCTSPFQSLLFLVRDWQNDDEIGIEAGRQLLDEKFKFHASSNAAMKTLRKDIERSFRDMKCFVLPSPGDKIRKGSEGEITVDDMDPDFQEGLLELVPYLFGKLMLPKEIGGKQITGAEFVAFFKTYSDIFASGKVPEPKSIYDVTAEATHQSALDCSIEQYKTTMKMKFSQLVDGESYEENRLRTVHHEATAAAVKLFEDTRKMGSLPQFLKTLNEKIEEQFKEVYLKDNMARIKIAREKKEKAEAEKRRLEQERKAREERIRYEREQEEMRIQFEKEKKEREATERRRLEEAKRHEEEKQRAMQERREAERRMREEQERQNEIMRRENERREREREAENKRQMERIARERREREEEAERLRQQMERMRLESEREREAQNRRSAQAERRAREEAEQRQQMAFQSMMQQHSFGSPFGGHSFGGGSEYGGPSFGGSDCFGPSYSNASRSGTPSGRSPGRPRGSVMDRAAMGIMPSEGATTSWNILRRNGYDC